MDRSYADFGVTMGNRTLPKSSTSQSDRAVAWNYNPIDDSRSAKTDGSTAVAGSRLDPACPPPDPNPPSHRHGTPVVGGPPLAPFNMPPMVK